MGSSDGNQDPNETPDLTNNDEAVDINADAQKVKKFAKFSILCSYLCNVNKFQRKNKQMETLLVQTTDTSTDI